MKKNDIILLFCILIFSAILFCVLFFALNGHGAVAVIRIDGEEYARLPLNEDTELSVVTEHGTNLVVIKEGQAFISDADCKDRVCVRTGVASEMRSVVCAPHRLTLTIEEAE